MSGWVQLSVGLATSYLAATLSESYLHRTVGHATPRLRRLWARHPRLCGFLARAHYRHAVVHHGLTFKRDHVTQFLDAADQARVDEILAPRGDRLIEKEHYGLTICLRGLLTFNVAMLPYAVHRLRSAASGTSDWQRPSGFRYASVLATAPTHHAEARR